MFGDRWLLAGDAAGFIDPVFSSGVYLALLSGEQAADALNLVLDQPQKRAKAFRHYERRVSRVLDIYLRWASAWYTQEFVEVFLFPKKIFELVPTVSAVLSGNEIRDFGMRWRLCIFHMLIAIQKRTSKSGSQVDLDPESFMTSRIFILLTTILLAGCQSAKEISVSVLKPKPALGSCNIPMAVIPSSAISFCAA